MWKPCKMLRTKDWQKLECSRLYIFNLVIQDHIESIGKPILLKGMRCCLMACLLKVLSEMLQNPQPLSHIHICPKPEVKLGPTDLIYQAPPSSFDIATARNPNQFGLTDGISVSPRWACKLSLACCNYFSPTETSNRSHRVCLTNSLFSLLPKSVPPSLCNRSNRDEALP